MSLREVIELLNDLKESHKQITLRLKLIEVEISALKENIPGRITNFIEKTENFDKKVSQKYIEKLLAKKLASKHSYQKGSMDEKLIQEFLDKNKDEETQKEEIKETEDEEFNSEENQKNE